MMSPLVQFIQELEELLSLKLYIVGGAVRNSLMGLVIKDYDFTTPATPDQIEQAIREAGYKPYTIGKRFGTIGCKYQHKSNLNKTIKNLDQEPEPKTQKKSPLPFLYIEITTFRSEQYQARSRKPTVTFVSSIDQDLSRRDLTINAMALDSSGVLIDPFGGQADLESGIIRAVGKPKHRFSEDPLRLLRAVRFAGTYGFEIEAATYKAIQEGYHKLLDISKERWVMELDKILLGGNVEKSLEMLMTTRLFNVLIPELILQVGYDQNSSYHDFDLWTHTKKVVASTPQDHLELRWAALLHDVGQRPQQLSISRQARSRHNYQALQPPKI
jgi:tRNA nucleotidyltransferase (CCA-adding enzyme)